MMRRSSEIRKKKKNHAKRNGSRWEALSRALVSLDPAGGDGFEGLLRELLQSLTGEPFRLMKSGPQGGIDTLQESAANSLVVGVEGKRYGSRSRLALDALKAKLVDAASSHPGLDLWILATTREVSATDRASLITLGESMGVAVEVLDWPRFKVDVPALGLMLAAAPDVAHRFLSPGAEVRAELATIAVSRDFNLRLEQLRTRLTRADIGYVAAQRAVAGWLRRSMTSLASAKANLGGYTNVLDPAVERVRRWRVEASLDEWWNEGALEPCVLLGEEGVGKTWALLLWWERHAGPQGDSRPLTLVIPARDLELSRPDELVAAQLARITRLRSFEFWLRRVRMWLSSPPSSGPRIVLAIDGLNERWTFSDWSTPLQRFFADECAGQFAVLMTCRPDHWNVQLKGLADLVPPVRTVNVEIFNDEELDTLLSAHGLSRSEFDDAMISIMRVPRLCQLAIGLRAELRDTGDVTRERLIFEDWRRRLERRGAALALGNDEFLRLAASWGSQLRAQISHQASGSAPTDGMTRAALLSELGRDSGDPRENLLATLSEIVDGRWLTPVEGQRHRFRLHRQLAPFALGLALVDELKSCVAGETPERLAVFLDPLQGQDFAAEVLRAASAIAIFDEGSTNTLRETLIRSWISVQNLRVLDFGAFWRLIGHTPALFLDVMRGVWLQQTRSYLRDEILIKGMAMAAKRPHVDRMLRERITEWLGFYWVVPERHLAAVARNVKAWEDGTPSEEPRVRLHRVENAETEQGFAKRLIALMSVRPRASLTEGLIAWAISRTVMQESAQIAEIEWLLRWNPFDPQQAEAAVLAAADRLRSSGNEIGERAADLLLSALATPSAMQKRSPFIQYSPQRAPRKPRTKAPGWRGLAAKALDPQLDLSRAERAEMKRRLLNPRVSRMWSRDSQEPWEHGIEACEEALGRWVPGSWANVLRKTFGTAPARGAEALATLALKLEDRLLVLDDAQTVPFGALRVRIVDDRFGLVHSSIVMARLAGRKDWEQVRILNSLNRHEGLNASHDAVFVAPTKAAFDELATLLSTDAPNRRVKTLLSYLLAVPLTAMPDGYPPLLELLRHPDSHVRTIAIHLIHSSGQQSLQTSLMRSGWRYAAQMLANEAMAGSRSLCEASVGKDVETRRDVRRRIAPYALGWLLMAHPEDPELLDAYADFVDENLSRALVQKTRAIGQYDARGQEQALVLLLRHREARVRRWIDTLLETPLANWSPASCLDGFPVVTLCEVLLDHEPQTGLRLWRKMIAPNDYGRGSDKLVMLPVAASDAEGIDEARAKSMAFAVTDQQLFDVVMHALRHGREAWLLRCIRSDLQSQCAGTIARGITVAGWLDESSESIELWENELDEVPAAGWLAEVYAQAARRFRQNRWARHWMRAFIAERDRDQAYGFFMLFRKCADSRARVWAHRLIDAEWEKLPQAWRVHWKVYVNEMREPEPGRTDEMTTTLYGLDVVHGQGPWL